MKTLKKYKVLEHPFYDFRTYSKIHLEDDTDFLVRKFKSYISFWGAVGYLGWDYMIRNNKIKVSLIDLEKCISKMGELYTNDKSLVDFKEKDIKNKLAKDQMCRDMCHHLTANDFTETLNKFLTQNTVPNIVVIKFMTPRLDSVIGVNSIDKIKSDRWMSFTILPDAIYSDVINNPGDYLLKSSVGKTNTFEFLVMQLPLKFKYVKTNNLCDFNEILINSNEIIKYTDGLIMKFVDKTLEYRDGGLIL